VVWPSPRRLALAVAALICGLTLTVSLWTPGELVRTEDQNHDGRPDVWRYYDRHGRLDRVDVDTNFDGRADRRTFYRDGILTRTETDRNFDNQIDLIEEFDLLGREHIRSVVDANFDGTADLLVLFQNGQPVHSEWRTPPPHSHDVLFADRIASAAATAASASTPAAASAPGSAAAPPPASPTPWHHADVATDALVALEDPFVADTALRAMHRPRAPDSIAVTAPTVMLREPVMVAGLPGRDLTPFALPLASNPRSTTPHRLPARAPPSASPLG
jgi:hypothetical protein